MLNQNYNQNARTGCSCGIPRSACGCGSSQTWERRNFGSCGCGNEARATRSGCGCGTEFSGASTVWKNREGGCSCGAAREGRTCDQGAEDCGLLDGQSLAMVYSPYQKYEDLYGAKEGLCNGTIFCRLNKPFYGDGRR